jgi:hypothetical protein
MRNLRRFSPRSADEGSGRNNPPEAQMVCLALVLALTMLAARIVSVL